MRLFVAIELVLGVKVYLRGLQQPLRSLHAKLSFTKDFHLTLKFLGEVPGNRLPEVQQALGRIAFTQFTMVLTQAGMFPDERYPRVIWVGAEPHERIIALQRDIDKGLAPLGFEKDKRFHPHITLARVKFIKDKVSLPTRELTMPVTGFALIESTLTPQGPIYRTIQTYAAQ